VLPPNSSNAIAGDLTANVGMNEPLATSMPTAANKIDATSATTL
jgi:hypothetical protein